MLLAATRGLQTAAMKTVVSSSLRQLSTGPTPRAALLAAPAQLPNIPLKWIAAGCAGAVAIWLARSSVLMTDAGVTYVVQNNLTGQLDVYTEPGL